MSMDYMPTREAEFGVWQDNLVAIVKTKIREWNISVVEFIKVEEVQAKWKAAYKKSSKKSLRSAADVLAKNEAFAEYKLILCKFIVNELLFSDYLTDVDRKSMELNIHDKKPTPSPVPSRLR